MPPNVGSVAPALTATATTAVDSNTYLLEQALMTDIHEQEHERQVQQQQQVREQQRRLQQHQQQHQQQQQAPPSLTASLSATSSSSSSSTGNDPGYPGTAAIRWPPDGAGGGDILQVGDAPHGGAGPRSLGSDPLDEGPGAWQPRPPFGSLSSRPKVVPDVRFQRQHSTGAPRAAPIGGAGSAGDESSHNNAVGGNASVDPNPRAAPEDWAGAGGRVNQYARRFFPSSPSPGGDVGDDDSPLAESAGWLGYDNERWLNTIPDEECEEMGDDILRCFLAEDYVGML